MPVAFALQVSRPLEQSDCRGNIVARQCLATSCGEVSAGFAGERLDPLIKWGQFAPISPSLLQVVAEHLLIVSQPWLARRSLECLRDPFMEMGTQKLG